MSESCQARKMFGFSFINMIWTVDIKASTFTNLIQKTAFKKNTVAQKGKTDKKG